MFSKVRILFWTASSLILVNINLIIDVRGEATLNKPMYWKNEPSLASVDGSRSASPGSKTPGEIDEPQTLVTTSVSTVQKRNLLSNEFTAAFSVSEVTNQALQGKLEEKTQTRKKKTNYELFSYRENANEETEAAVDEQYLTNSKIDHRYKDNRPLQRLLNLHSKDKIFKNVSNVYTEIQKQDDVATISRTSKTSILTNYMQFHILKKRNIEMENAQTRAFGQGGGITSLPYTTSNNENIIPLVMKDDKNEVNTTNEVAVRRHRHTVASASAAAATNNRNIRAREEGDAIIGALFPLHRSPTQKSAYTRQCGEIWENYGIQRVETFLMTIDRINRDPTILPNIKLGWDIRDSCWYSAIALENSIDFIKDAIATQAKLSNADSSLATTSAMLSLNGTTAPPRGKEAAQACREGKHLKPIIGLVGPGSSEATIQVQNLLQIFNIPQIGYSATSMELSDKSRYKYFLRVVPPDRFQAQVLVDLLVMFNWTYISAVHSDGNYGFRGMEKFKDLAKAKGVCIAVVENVASTAEEAFFDRILKSLLEHPNASVVVCFCEGMTVKNLFSATTRLNVEGKLLIIGSDGWGNRPDVVQNVESAASGAISIMLHSPRFMDFGPHYAKLKPPKGSPKNPWFNEFWEFRFNCSLDKNDLRHFSKACSGNESLEGAEEDSKLGFVVNAVTTMARALHSMHQDLCPGHEGLCSAMKPIDGSMYLQYLLNVSFESYSKEEVHFDSHGDPPGRYDILSYQPKINGNGSTTYDYVTIGRWISGTLTLNFSKVYWPTGGQDNRDAVTGFVKSVCSEPCKRGQAKKVKGVACCWICTTCLENEILVGNNTDCKSCDLGMWPDNNKTDCEEIPIDFIDWSDTEAIVCITLGALGICATMWVFAIFIRYHNTPVVKASTRELSYILLVGICLAFCANFVTVSKPAKGYCYLTRIIPGLSFSLMYGALVTRTNRIARILEGSKRIMTKKPKFMSATAQVVITSIIIGIECAVITGMLVYQPADSKLDYPAPRKVRLVCDTSTLGIVVPLGFDLVLILLCTIYAVKTRNLPENFNEAKFIGFTMYATCVIWLGFFPIYFAGENKEVTLSISVSLSAAIALVLLFVPKVYVIIWVPEKNTRGAFATSRDVRCHIGSKSIVSGDSIDIKESSTYDCLLKSDKSQPKHWKQKSLDEKRLRFVMQRAGCGDDESPYINHGVLPNHSNLRSTTFMNVDTIGNKEHSPAGSHGCSEVDKLGSGEISKGEAIRQNLEREFHMQKRQVTLRPGSPAEREKHRIHNVDQMLDLEELLREKSKHAHIRFGKSGDFRKALSSTCVSTCPKIMNAQCQTSDDLVDYLLPPLRKRHVSKSKNKLERSPAVDDVPTPLEKLTEAGHAFKYAATKHSPVRRTTSPAHADDPHISSLEPAQGTSLAIFHTLDQAGMSLLPVVDSECSSLLGTNILDHKPRRHSHTISHSNCLHHRSDLRRHCSTDSTLSSLILHSSNTNHQKDFNLETLTPRCCISSNVLDCYEVEENFTNPSYHDQRNSVSSHRPIVYADSDISSQNVSDSNWSSDQEASEISLTHQESSCSASVSIDSSSFTIPAFQNSTDSNTTQQTFGDSDNSLEIEQSYSTTPNEVINEENELEDNRKNNPHFRGDYVFKSNGLNSEAKVVSLEALEREDDDVLEFQKYLQGHGVKLDLTTVKSSDV